MIDAKRLPHRRIRFGFSKRISEIRKNIHIDNLFEKTKTFAIFRLTGKPKDIEENFFKLTREELSILSLSQLGYSKRKNNSHPSISDENPIGKHSVLFVNSIDSSIYMSNKITGKILPLCLDQIWKNVSKRLFFYKLLKIMQGEIEVSSSWRAQLYNASILAGQSQFYIDMPQAFLNNMIAIELLLTERSDKYREALPSRAEAFLGWVGFWDSDNYEAKIKEVYSKRCALVHAGDRNCITYEDLLFTDRLILNLLNNIVKHISIFKSKKDVIDFSRKIEAEHTLNLKPSVRPKTFEFIH